MSIRETWPLIKNVKICTFIFALRNELQKNFNNEHFAMPNSFRFYHYRVRHSLKERDVYLKRVINNNRLTIFPAGFSHRFVRGNERNMTTDIPKI